MILDRQSRHSARYDEDGNILLPGDGGKDSMRQEVEKDIPLWTTTDDDDVPLSTPVEEPVQSPSPVAVTRSTRRQMLNVTSEFLQEGVLQYRSSFDDFLSAFTGLPRVFSSMGKHLCIFLTQPVWVLRKEKKPKEYTRLSLFLIDTVRFGGTFAALFGVLFVSLNYESFGKIALSNLSPLQQVQAGAGLSDVEEALRSKLLRSPSLAIAGSEEGDLLSYLPDVGPPENRIIIPRLGLNIPLVNPAYDALLREDWKQLETDIQDSLAEGVVHYPGTARPGQAGNFFVTGHSSYYPWAAGKYKTVFARLHELQVGDEYWVYYGGDKYRYIVRGKREVKPSDVTVLDQPTGQRMATLMTCTPVGTTLRRLIISSEEVDPVTGIALEVGEQHSRPEHTIKVEALPI